MLTHRVAGSILYVSIQASRNLPPSVTPKSKLYLVGLMGLSLLRVSLRLLGRRRVHPISVRFALVGLGLLLLSGFRVLLLISLCIPSGY